MIYLSKSEITRINKKVTLLYGGLFLPPHNFFNEGALDYAIEIVKTNIFGAELYPTIYLKAAVYKFNIISNHIFNDGNKRTGFAAILLFFEKNMLTLKDSITNEDLISFTFLAAKNKLSIEEIADWYSQRVTKLD